MGCDVDLSVVRLYVEISLQFCFQSNKYWYVDLSRAENTIVLYIAVHNNIRWKEFDIHDCSGYINQGLGNK